jgi:hypothetical protein
VDASRMRFRAVAGQFEDGKPGIAAQIDLRAMIRRCVRGFHVALYREPLIGDGTRFMTTPPMPELQMNADGARYKEVPAVAEEFVKELKRNRRTRTLDRIECRKGRCRHQCLWSLADDGRYLCIHGFDLYGWKGLGDNQHFEVRGCVGAYRTGDGSVPARGTGATRLAFDVENRDRLDPFGE